MARSWVWAVDLNRPFDMSAEQFQPFARTGGVGLAVSDQSSADYADFKHPNSHPAICGDPGCSKSADEPCVITSETEARRLVTAVENCRPSDVIAVIKRQPWFEEIRRGVRKTRHLAPNTYLHLSGHVRASERPREMARS